MRIKFLGHASFLLEIGDHRVIIDPFISGNPQSPISVDDLPKVDYILVTHGHGDHMGDTVEIAKKYDSIVITNFEISVYLEGKGVKTHSMHIGGKYEFPFGTVKMFPALHGSGIVTNHSVIYGGNPCGFLIRTDEGTVYHAGDTGLSMEMKLLEMEKVDVAILPIGGNYVMDVEDAVIAVDFIKPKMVIPMHYNTWDIIRADEIKFKNLVEGKGIKCSILKPGEYVEIGR